MAAAANGSARGAALFKDENIRDMSGVVKGEDFIEVTCGCTSKKLGDFVGRLKVYESGDLDVRCECIKGCQEEIMTPSEFETHARGDAPKRWKNSIWVIVRGKKVPLLKTALLKYYNRAEKATGLLKGNSAKTFHHDEFISCVECKKERRFRLQSKEECRIHHDAVLNRNWKCSDFPHGMLSCDDDEERASRKKLRGCPCSTLCNGCTSCVCFGCELCRFENCNCQLCVDFVTNADIKKIISSLFSWSFLVVRSFF